MFRTSFATFLILGLLGTAKAQAACDQTLSPGANVASAVANAVAGSTICLNAGSYGAVSLSSVNKSSDVILQSVSGRTAMLSLTLQSSSRLKFQSLTIQRLNMWSGGNKNISILNNTFTGQAMVQGSGSSSTPANILIDGNTFDGITVGPNDYEGRLQLYDAGGVIVSNNHFGGRGDSDGIQWGGYGGQVGPGNVFEDLVYTGSRHVDSIQLYGEVDHHTIIGNYFRRNSDCIMAPDGGANVTIRDNVFVGNDTSSGEIQLGSQINAVFIHNTVIGMAVTLDKKSESPVYSSNGVMQDNLFFKRSRVSLNCTNCNISHNMFDTSSSQAGSGNLIGNPTFVGGTSPTTMAGWALTSSSIGVNAGLDGKNMGSNYFGGAIVQPPPPPPPAASLAAPTNLRLVSVAYNKISVQWDYSGSGQSGFIVNRKLGASGSLSQVATTTALSYADSAVSASSTYCYQVKAYDASSQSAASNELCATTPAAPVVQPPPEPTPSPSPTGTWIKCAVEGQTCRVSGTKQVRYGAQGQYVTKSVTTQIACTNSAFGRDPIYGVLKECHYLESSTAPAPAPVPAIQSLMASLVPASLSNSDGANVHYELGMRFTSTAAGKITAIRFYKSASESGSHTGKIYSSSGAVLASVVFSSESGSGWQEAKLSTPLSIAANTEYTVSVNTGNTYYVITVNGLASQRSSTNLRSVVGSNGVYGPVGKKPTSSWQNSNYFRDVVFVPN